LKLKKRTFFIQLFIQRTLRTKENRATVNAQRVIYEIIFLLSIWIIDRIKCKIYKSYKYNNMGIYLSKPNTDKSYENGQVKNIHWGAIAMQGIVLFF